MEALDPLLVCWFREGPEALARRYPAQRRDRTAFTALEAVKGAREFLAKVAGKPGALRGMVKTMRVAAMLATGAGVQVPDITHYRAAWSRLSTSS